MILKASINTKNARKRLSRLEDEIIEKGSMTVTELGKMGQNYAKSIVYYDTGFTFKSIKRRTKRRASGSEATIFIDPYIRPVDGVHRRSHGKYSNFSLVRWSHTSPAAKGHIKSGDPEFMYTTREYLESIKGRTARGQFKSIKV